MISLKQYYDSFQIEQNRMSVTNHLLQDAFVIKRIVFETICLIDPFLGGGRTSFWRMSRVTLKIKNILVMLRLTKAACEMDKE